MKILETERLLLRELEAERDAAFVRELLNTPKFLEHIGDRGVRTIDEAREFIETRYRQSYRERGYGLYAVDLREGGESIGICGFVRRDSLRGPDLGFAFLPQHERQGYGYESAAAMMNHGRETLGFQEAWAITSLGNDASIALLKKLRFTLDTTIESDGETLNLFHTHL